MGKRRRVVAREKTVTLDTPNVWPEKLSIDFWNKNATNITDPPLPLLMFIHGSRKMKFNRSTS